MAKRRAAHLSDINEVLRNNDIVTTTMIQPEMRKQLIDRKTSTLGPEYQPHPPSTTFNALLDNDEPIPTMI